MILEVTLYMEAEVLGSDLTSSDNSSDQETVVCGGEPCAGASTFLICKVVTVTHPHQAVVRVQWEHPV